MDRDQVLRFVENQRWMNRMVDAERRAMTTEQRIAETMLLFRRDPKDPDSETAKRAAAHRRQQQEMVLETWARIRAAYRK